MRFFRNRRSRDPSQRAIAERQEQKARSAHADAEYYKAMRRFAIEAGDAEGVRRYTEKLQDIEYLRAEREALEGRRYER